MASDAFTGTAGTALATHDANWKANTNNDGVTGLELDGSGHLRATQFATCDTYYDDGTTGANSISHATFPAGITIDASGNLMGVGCRTTSTQRGYQAFLKSSTNVNTNLDQIGVRRNGAFVSNQTITAINANTTVVDLKIQLVNTVDIKISVNGTDYTLAGTGGNDVSGAAVLTGGFPSIMLYRNGGTQSAFTVDAWTDDAAAGGTVNTKTAEDTIAVGDTTLSGAVRNRIPQSLLALADDTPAGAVRTRIPQSLITLTDQATLFYLRTSLASDTLDVFDQLLAQFTGTILKILTDTIDVTDGPAQGYSIYLGDAADAIDQLDETALMFIKGRLSDDALEMSDGAAQFFQRNRDSSDALATSDSAPWFALRQRLLGDAIDVSEGPNVIFTEYALDAPDSLSVSDDTVIRYLRTRLAADAIAVTDEAIYSTLSLSVLFKILTETLDVSDETVASALRNRDAASQLLTSDVVTTSRVLMRDLIENLSIDDQPLRALQRFLVAEDAIVVDDSAIGLRIQPQFFSPRIVIGVDPPRILVGAAAPYLKMGGYAL
jgi:hypothetical protein